MILEIELTTSVLCYFDDCFGSRALGAFRPRWIPGSTIARKTRRNTLKRLNSRPESRGSSSGAASARRPSRLAPWRGPGLLCAAHFGTIARKTRRKAL